MASELEAVEHRFALPAMLFGDSGSFTIMPASSSADEIGYFATLEVEDRDRLGWDMLGDNKEELASMLSDRFLFKGKWPELVTALCRKSPPDSLTSWPFFSVPHLSDWSSKIYRVILIGDATQAIPPTGGQGAAMALEDAETLVYVLAEVFADDNAKQVPSAQDQRLAYYMRRWDEHRHARIAKVLDFTTKNGTLRKSSPHFYEQAAKEWLIWTAF
ncbi:hypothetical protein LTR66_012825 [Elasticomyces elasticus]|nr:hypothetical protein LTR66_012825 [Elasticomyces elasticus]